MYTLPDKRVQQIRRYFTERLQHKAALRKTGMRDYKVFLVNYPVAVEQKIKVHPAWSLMDRPDPFKNVIFDLKHGDQQRTGVKPCRESDYRVVKRILCYSAHRRCLIKRRECRHPALRQPANLGNGLQQVEFTVPEVGTNCYVGFSFHCLIKTQRLRCVNRNTRILKKTPR